METVCSVHILKTLNCNREALKWSDKHSTQSAKLNAFEGTFIVIDHNLYSAPIIISLKILSQLKLIATQKIRRMIDMR